MKTRELISQLLELPQDLEVAISTKAILEDGSDEVFSPEGVASIGIETADSGQSIIVLQS